MIGSWHRGDDDAYPWEETYRFTFLNGKINGGVGPWAGIGVG
jgi:hypothetical protein